MKIVEPIELYIHIPFCLKKCNYCDFLSYVPEEEEKEKYVEALLEQIRSVGSGLVPGCDPDDPDFEERDKKFRVSTIYIGGGTPTVLAGEQIKSILDTVFNAFDVEIDAEITMEANPGTIDYEKLLAIRNCGVNRLSLGLQSACADELKCLGRIHTFDEFLQGYEDARKAGFNNISVDIMTALPNQNEGILTDTLRKVIDIKPEHVSAYSLIIEEDTPFYDTYGDVDGPVVGEDMERRLYYLAKDELEKAGYVHYEISNFSKPSFESKHNCGYWQRKNYFGLGLGASSFFDRFRVTNTESMSEYVKNPCAFDSVNRLSDNDAMEEYMYLGLRMMSGISVEGFNKTFTADFDKLYGKRVEKLKNDGLIKQDGDVISLTDKGLDYGNFVFSQFLL